MASQVHGTWRKAEQVPGTAALNHGWAAVSQMSCPSAGSCGADGVYSTVPGYAAFVVSEVNGTWRKAEQVPGTAALNQGSNAEVYSLSCGAPGTCGAGGEYLDSSGHQQGFVASQNHGAWATAQQAPGTAALNKGGYAQVNQVSCASPGNCSAGGLYTGPRGLSHAFVIVQAHGTWDTAQQVPGLAALTHGGSSSFDVLSCAAPGRCSAGGSFVPAHSKRQQLFIVTQAPGTSYPYSRTP